MRGRTLIIFLAAGLLLIAVAGSALGQGAKRQSPTTIEVHDNFFDPRSATVARGETVRWTWKGDNRHNIAFKKVPAGASKRRIKGRSGGKASRSFPVPGNYRYVCTLYDGMEGFVTVTP